LLGPIPVLFNPAAGRGRVGRLAPAVLAELARVGFEPEPRYSRLGGELTDIAASCSEAGHDRLVAIGGDGTVSEVARGVLDAAGSVAIGIVPLGTGNDLVKSTDIPRDWRGACRWLAQGARPRRVDAGRVNGRWFVNGIGAGLAASIAQAASRRLRLPGPLPYAAGLLASLHRAPASPRCRISWADGSDERPVCLFAACNGRFAGGLFQLAPRARLDDGRLDLMWADALGRAAVLRHASRVMAGTHLDLPVVHVASSSWVEFECDEPLPVQVDGDVLGAGLQRLKAEIVPGALRLWC
jgi:YegS/Rv2252/BmrU family lipid kinase